jgi:hypothetical protein
MAIPSRQIGWGTESNLLWQILKQLTRLTSTLFSLKEAATPKYKVFTATLTQAGGDSPNLVIDLSLTIGVTYEIVDTDGDTVDFTNVGAPNNGLGTLFIATGTTPNSWGDNLLGELQYNEGAPVATVLENTIGNIWFSYKDIGAYDINSDSLFTELKTTVIMATPYFESDPADSGFYTTVCDSTEIIFMYTMTRKPELSDSYLKDTFIEIRVYNS